MIKTSSLFRSAANVLTALLALNAPLIAQTDGGPRPGIVLVKPQAWSKNEQAVVMEFEGFTDRTVKGTPGAGYYEFKTKAADKKQIPASKVVTLLVYPDPKNFPQIISTQDRDQVANLIKEMKDSMTEFPAAQTYINPPLKKLGEEIALYDSGKVKVGGVWQPRETYLSGQVANLGTQLRGDILRTDPPSSFDLNADPRFIALQELAGSSASANALAKELTALHDKLVRTEARASLLARLNDTSISLSEAEGAVARLKALNADEDPKSAAFLKKWETGVASVNAMNDAAKPLTEAFELEMTPVKAFDVLPQPSAELAAKISPLRDQVRLFVATNPAPVLLIDAKSPIALSQVTEGLTKLGPLFLEKRFLDAKDILDALISKSGIVGPETLRVISGLQTFTAEKIGQFSRQREEAQLLLSSGKREEALAKFEEAYATIADGMVAEEIAKLKPAPEKKD